VGGKKQPAAVQSWVTDDLLPLPAVKGGRTPAKKQSVGSVLTTTIASGPPDTLSTVPDLCVGIFLKFKPQQQVRSVNELLLVASQLLQSLPGVPADAATAIEDAEADEDEDMRPAGASVDAATLIEADDLRSVLPLLMTYTPLNRLRDLASEGGWSEDAKLSSILQGEALTHGQRYRLATVILRFISQLLGSRAFLAAAFAEPPPAEDVTISDQHPDGTDAEGSSSTAASLMQMRYLLCAKRLFDLLELAGAAAAAVKADSRPRDKQPPTAKQAQPATMAAADADAAAVSAKLRLWTSLSDALYGILSQLAGGLLEPAALVSVISQLLRNPPSLSGRGRSLVFLNDHLRRTMSGGRAVMRPAEAALYLDLVEDLMGIVSQPADPADGADAAAEGLSNRRTALDSIAILAEYFAKEYPETFSKPLASVLAMLGAGTGQWNSGLALSLRSSAVVCVSVLATRLPPPQSLPHLPTLFNAILVSLEWALGAPASPEIDVLRLSCLAALRLITRSLSGFLNPHLSRLVAAATHPAVSLAPVDTAIPLSVRFERLAIAAERPGKQTQIPTAPSVLDDDSAPAELPPSFSLSASAAEDADETTDVSEASLPGALRLTAFSSDAEQLSAPASRLASRMASNLLAELGSRIAPRVLLPALLGQWPAAATHFQPAADAPAAATPLSLTAAAPAVALLRAIRAAVTRLSKKEVPDQTPRLLRFLLTALDARRHSVARSSVRAILSPPEASQARPASARHELDAAAVVSSFVEVEAISLFVTFSLKMSEGQVCP
jgi:hypothetical protein